MWFLLHAESQWSSRKPRDGSKRKSEGSVQTVGGTSIWGTSCWRTWEFWSWHRGNSRWAWNYPVWTLQYACRYQICTYNLHLPAWQGNNSDDLKPCSQFPNLFSAGFCPSGRNENHPKFGIYIFHGLWRCCTVYINRVCWIKSLFRRKWRWQRTTIGGGGREENLPVLFPAAVLACPLQTHQGHAQVWCRSDWTEKVLLCSHTLLFFCSSKANADMVVCKYCMKTFRNKNSLGCHIWRWYLISLLFYFFKKLCTFCFICHRFKLFKVPQTRQRTDNQRAGISSIKSATAIIRADWKSITFSRAQFCLAFSHLSDLGQ